MSNNEMDDESQCFRRDSIWSYFEDDTFHRALAKQMKEYALSVSTREKYTNPFLDDLKDTDIDPTSQSFSIEAWLSNLVGLISSSPGRYTPRMLGFSFRNLNVLGNNSLCSYQKNVANFPLRIANAFRYISGSEKRAVQILHNFTGLVESGELLLVLGRPGSGCSTLLKTISGERFGLAVSSDAIINYQGITAKQMSDQFRGEAIYLAENDVHFPQLTVGQTLLFAAKARSPRDDTFPGVSKDMYAMHMRDVVMATFGITHTMDTNVGNDIVKGVSGGERKRVSLAEAALSGSCIQCWDNSTRGLDSANAIEFCKMLRLLAKTVGTTACVSLYQGPQQTYNLFDKVTVLYEGRQIYFGPCAQAIDYFAQLGFQPTTRQTTADFLTALTNPLEREQLIQPGSERLVPRTGEEFAMIWRGSVEYARLRKEIEVYEAQYPLNGQSLHNFTASRRSQQARNQSSTSPYTLSLIQQVKICTIRSFQLMRRDASVTISRVVSNSIMAFVISSIFYKLQDNTNSFFGRSVLIFFASLFNAFASALEILFLYAQRPIVEKQARYAFYRPAAEAIASFICDLPYKIYNSIFFNLILYFMTSLRRTPSAFFVFLLFMFMTTCTISMFYRTVGATSKTLAQALTPAALLNLSMMVYTGFVVPIPEMVPWFRWINYLNPIAYSFQALMINEYQGRTFDCSAYVPAGPAYAGIGGQSHVCTAAGSVAGSDMMTGDDYLRLNFEYYPNQLWRNFGILCTFFLFFTCTYLFATETIAAKRSKGEILVFRRAQHKQQRMPKNDVETGTNLGSTYFSPRRWVHKYTPLFPQPSSRSHTRRMSTGVIHKQTSVVQWRDVSLDIKVKKEAKRILDRIDGYIKPGTLTALMGPSGAGKTSLLDVLATRSSIGTIAGEVLVDGKPRDESFQRKTGYVQQQDVHLESSIVREALRFSALLRQPTHISKEDKYEYVEEIIRLLDMETYADAVIDAPGEGLNIEQRKKLTIATELAARPQLLLFLDEPTSGLDSQTAWSIITLLEMLNSHGQAILCTIHQPSATLFQKFHRLLFLGPNGQVVYFGELGPGCQTIIGYFERNGAKKCPPEANPAEWMMEVIGCTPGSCSEIDWPEVWRQSPEYAELHRELDRMKKELPRKAISSSIGEPREYEEFAAPFWLQLWECLKRANSFYWHDPSYIYSKTALCLFTGLFLGFSLYQSSNSLQNLQNQVFGIFMMIAIISCNFVPQILPSYVTLRTLFESRESPAKIYSWSVFVLTTILVELPWNTLMSVIVFVTWYYPIGLYKNAGGETVKRGGVAFMLIWVFFVYISTFAQFVMAGFELAELAGNLANCAFLFGLMFCGILATPTALPGFWIFMYRLSPFTYLVASLLAVGFSDAPIVCSDIEVLHFLPPVNTTCASYMAPYIQTYGGYLINSNATASTGQCSFCPLNNTNVFLETVDARMGDVWRNFGILWVYVFVNVCGALGVYWCVRVRRRRG